MKDRIGPRERAWEVDGHGATFARSDTPSHCSDNQRTDPSECLADLADSRSRTRPSRCRDQCGQDAEMCPRAGCGLTPSRENFSGTQPHATPDLARTRGALPIAETSLLREKRHFG